MDKGFADIELIREVLEKNTAKVLSEETSISLSQIKKLKSGERSIEKLTLANAIKLTDFAIRNRNAEFKIEIWQ